MKRTLVLKQLVGLDPTPSGIGSHQRTDHECTVCGATFATTEAICPACGSHLFRERTRTRNATFNLLFVVAVTGFAIVYNLLTGEYPREGPGA